MELANRRSINDISLAYGFLRQLPNHTITRAPILVTDDPLSLTLDMAALFVEGGFHRHGPYSGTLDVWKARRHWLDEDTAHLNVPSGKEVRRHLEHMVKKDKKTITPGLAHELFRDASLLNDLKRALKDEDSFNRYAANVGVYDLLRTLGAEDQIAGSRSLLDCLVSEAPPGSLDFVLRHLSFSNRAASSQLEISYWFNLSPADGWTMEFYGAGVANTGNTFAEQGLVAVSEILETGPPVAIEITDPNAPHMQHFYTGPAYGRANLENRTPDRFIDHPERHRERLEALKMGGRYQQDQWLELEGENEKLHLFLGLNYAALVFDQPKTVTQLYQLPNEEKTGSLIPQETRSALISTERALDALKGFSS